MEATEKIINTGDARNGFSDLLSRAAYSHESTVIAKRGREMAALIPIEEFRLYERLLEEYRDRVDVEAADAVMADADDEIVPFERTT